MVRLFSIMLYFFVTAVSAETFQAPVTDTQWHVTETPLECAMLQPIPGYGEAGFTRETGGPLTLFFSTYNHPSTQNNAQFEIGEAPWQNSDDRVSLTSIPTDSGQVKFMTQGLFAEQALTQFEHGQFPVITYRSLANMKDITVMLSTVHLLDSLNAFQTCLANLHPDTFDEVKFLTIYFDLEKSDLTAASRYALDRLAGYIKVDEKIKEVHITSHTDNHGRKSLNEPLSQARADAIRNYLIDEHGINDTLFRIESYVEKKPAATNKTQLGRAYNRRAEISLIR